jgi:hypothetical protein
MLFCHLKHHHPYFKLKKITSHLPTFSRNTQQNKISVYDYILILQDILIELYLKTGFKTGVVIKQMWLILRIKDDSKTILIRKRENFNVCLSK